MGKSSSVNTTKPRWKRSAEKGTLVGVRLQADQLKAIDVWAAKQKPAVTRPEAIRGILALGLRAKAAVSVLKPGRAPDPVQAAADRAAARSAAKGEKK
jgi:hypothetical protein